MAARRTRPDPDPDRRELDDAVVRRAQAGDPAACRAVVERYQAAVFALVGRMLGAARAAQVEDVAQDTFLAVFKALPGFTPDGGAGAGGAGAGGARLSTWILAIASRRAIDELRRPRLIAVAAAPDAIAPARGDDTARRREVAAAVERAVAELAPEYRAAFLLREYHELDYGEIAAALGVDLGTVKSRLSRARQALRAALAEIHHD